jgi:hypothetical protein
MQAPQRAPVVAQPVSDRDPEVEDENRSKHLDHERRVVGPGVGDREDAGERRQRENGQQGKALVHERVSDVALAVAVRFVPLVLIGDRALDRERSRDRQQE